MAMRLRIVCPESEEYNGDAAFVSVPTTDGQLGVLPRHASEVCTTEAGVVRICANRMGEVTDEVAIAAGYAQVADDEIIILAERACDLSKIDSDAVQRELAGFEDQLRNTAADDARRAYLYNEIAWRKLLLAR